MSDSNNILIDGIYDMFDRWFRADCFGMSDDMIAGCDVDRVPIDILRAYLTATLPAKSKLPSRAAFVERCRAIFGDELLGGLE